jgi:hypothetical protein
LDIGAATQSAFSWPNSIPPFRLSSNSTPAYSMERLQQLGELTGGTDLGVHHENKSGDANGSMYFQNNGDFMFQTSRDGEGPLERGKLTCVKQNEDDDLWSREVTFAKVELPDGKSSLSSSLRPAPACRT